MSLTNAYWNPPMIKAGESSEFHLDGPATTGKIKGENAPTGDISVPSVTKVTFPTAGRYTWTFSDTHLGNHAMDGGQSAFALIIVS
jgi:hypothetical protein